jgi:hypothetical protein
MPILAALIPILLTGLRIMLMAKIGAFCAKLLLFFGFSWATNEFAVEPAMDFLEAHMHSMPGGEYGNMMVQWLGVLHFDVAVSMVLSAYVAAWGIKSAKVFLMKQPV